MLKIHLPNETLPSLRFAYSPLLELTVSYRLLRGDWQRATYWRWMEEAHQAISDTAYPYMDALITGGHSVKGYNRAVPKGYIPDFLTPTPPHPISDIETEFERILNLPEDLIREGVSIAIEFFGASDIRCDFLAHPREGMQALITEMRDYWQRTLAHHWHRMIAVLENDILHHSRILTLDGIEALFPTLSETLAYENGVIQIGKIPENCDEEKRKYFSSFKTVKQDVSVALETEKFHLVPAIFAGNSTYHQVNEPWQPMILYTPRGAGLWNYEVPEPSQALELTLGAGKSRILLALATPYSTGELARKLSLTAGAVSQQLGKLHQAGLVESHRSGKHVFYRLSQRGTNLVALFC